MPLKSTCYGKALSQTTAILPGEAPIDTPLIDTEVCRSKSSLCRYRSFTLTDNMKDVSLAEELFSDFSYYRKIRTYLKIVDGTKFHLLSPVMLRLRDEQWERIREHFPEEHIPDSRPGRKPVPTRAAWETVLWILNTGAQWPFLPPVLSQWGSGL